MVARHLAYGRADALGVVTPRVVPETSHKRGGHAPEATPGRVCNASMTHHPLAECGDPLRLGGLRADDRDDACITEVSEEGPGTRGSRRMDPSAVSRTTASREMRQKGPERILVEPCDGHVLGRRPNAEMDGVGDAPSADVDAVALPMKGHGIAFEVGSNGA